MKNIERVLAEYLSQHPPAAELFQKLLQLGNVYLIGGVLREFCDKQDIVSLRDIDIIVDTENEEEYRSYMESYNPTVNRFGGYKIVCSGLIFDSWLLKKTWAYTENYVSAFPDKYAEKLIETVFLNMDAIVYDIKNNIWYDKPYREAMRTRVLDTVLEQNPYLELNIVRSLVIKNRYNMKYSNKLKSIIKEYINHTEHFADNLYNVAKARYGTEILNRIELQEELKQIMSAADDLP